MSNAIIGGQISVTIGGNEIKLTTADLTVTPMAYTLAAGQNIDISLSDLNNYLHANFGIPPINFNGISETNIVISSFTISTAGLFEIAVNFVFGSGKGWAPFPNLPGFVLNEVGITVDYATVPVISSFTPASTTVGSSITVTVNGNDLLGPSGGTSTIYFSTSPTLSGTPPPAGTPSATAASGGTQTQISITTPNSLTAGNYYLYAYNTNGLSSPSSTTLAITAS